MQDVPGGLFGVWLIAARATVAWLAASPKVVVREALCRPNNPQDEASAADAFTQRIAWKYCEF
jgi:hypothetical protein